MIQIRLSGFRDGISYAFSVPISGTVTRIKERMYERTKFAAQLYSLEFGGKEVKDTCALNSLAIVDRSEFVVKHKWNFYVPGASSPTIRTAYGAPSPHKRTHTHTHTHAPTYIHTHILFVRELALPTYFVAPFLCVFYTRVF